MIDVDAFVENLVTASSETEPRLAVRDVLHRALASSVFEEAFGGPTAGLNVLYNSDTLTVLNVVWPPHMTLYPHDHRMWAAIGIYGGSEENLFYRRSGHAIEMSGSKSLTQRDVLLLGDDVIHSVHNPLQSHTGAVHVYGGDFIRAPRSQWPPETLVEEPYDLGAVRREFSRAEQAASVGSGDKRALKRRRQRAPLGGSNGADVACGGGPRRVQDTSYGIGVGDADFAF